MSYEYYILNLTHCTFTFVGSCDTRWTLISRLFQICLSNDVKKKKNPLLNLLNQNSVINLEVNVSWIFLK